MFYLWLIGGTQYNPGALPWFWPHAGAGKAGGSSRSGPWKRNHPTSHDKRGTLDPPQTTRTENSSASLPASLYWRADTNWWLRPPLNTVNRWSSTAIKPAYSESIISTPPPVSAIPSLPGPCAALILLLCVLKPARQRPRWTCSFDTSGPTR